MAYSRDDRKEVFKFFEDILVSSNEPEIHYERLRGYVSSTAPEIVRKYVHRECRAEKLLEYFKKRKNYFYVSDKYLVGLVKRRDTHQSSDSVSEMNIDEFNEYDDEGIDYDSFISFNSSKSNSEYSSIVSTCNSACGDDSCNTSRLNDEIKRNEEITLRYFCKKLENGEERTVDSINVDSKKAQRYLKKYMKNSVRAFLCHHPKVFDIDDHDYVSLISNPFLKTTPYQQEILSVSLESSTGNEIQEESSEDFEKQTIDNILICADFFVKILKKRNPIHINKLSGYLSKSHKILVYLKVNYSHFCQFFHDIPQLFILNKDVVSLSGDYARLLKEAKKLYSKSKNVYSSKPVEDAIKLLFPSGNKIILSEINEMHIPEIKNSDLNKDNFSNEVDSMLPNNTFFDEASSSTEYSSSKDTEVSDDEVSKLGLEVLEKSKSMMSAHFEDKNITESQRITPVSCPEQDAVQKLTVHETKTLVVSKLENTHCLVPNSCNFTDNKVLQIMISWEGFFGEIQNFFNAKNMDTLIAVKNNKEIFCVPSQKDMCDFVDILYTVELLCLEKIEVIHNLKLKFEYKAVKFFTEILEKNLTIGCGINSLRGSLGQAPPDILSFMNQLYKGDKIEDFFKNHEEFIVSHELVQLSSSYKNTLRDKLSYHEKYTNGKTSYNLGKLYNSNWYKTYVDAYGCFCEIFCFLAKKEKHEFKLNRLSGFVSKLSSAQQDFINSFCGKGLAEKTECFLNYFRVFSYPNEDYVKIDPDCHISFLSHCVKKFADLLKDEKTKLSDFCYLLNNCVNSDSHKHDYLDIKSTTDLRCNIVESVETFLRISSYIAYSTLPSILDDILLDLVMKQIFSFGIINVLEECSLFQVRNKEISLKNEHMDEIDHSEKNFNNIAADSSGSNCGNAEVSQRESNISHLINGIEDKSETIETDEMKICNNIKIDCENKTSESQDINLYCTTGKANLTEITDFETAKDLNNININSYLDQNSEEKTSEGDKVSKNGVIVNNDNNDIIKEIFESEAVNGKEILPNLQEKISAELSKNFYDFVETNDFHNSLLTETNQNIDSEGEDEIFHNDDRFENGSPDVLRKESSFVLLNSSLINESLERKLENISSKESDAEIYNVGANSQSKMIFKHELEDKLSVTDSVSPASLTGSDIKEVETDTLITSPPEIYSVVPQLQKVANIEICPIDTYQKKLPVRYLSSPSEQHTEIASVNKKYSFTCEHEIEELELRPEYLSNDSKLNNRKLDVSVDSDTLVCDIKDSREITNDILLEKLANVNSLNEEESEINDKQPIISKYEAEEFRLGHESLSCNSETNNREFNLYTDSDVGECDLKNSRETIYENLLTEKSIVIDSLKEQSDECKINDKLCIDSNALVCDLKRSIETVNDYLLSENDPKIECIQTFKGSASQDFQSNRNSQVQSSEEINTVHAEKFRASPPAKEKQSSIDLSVSDMESKEDEKEIINQMPDHCCSEEVIQDLPVISVTVSKNIEKESATDNRRADNENYQDEPNYFIDASCFANFYSADSSVSEVAEIENIPTNSKSENLSVGTSSFSEDSSRKSSDQNDNNYSKNYVRNQNLDVSFFQPLSAKVVLLTLDSCVAESTINGENKLVFCLKYNFHCDQHTDCLKCFDSLSIGDKISCYIPPEGICKVGNMSVSFMFCKDTPVVEECQTSNSFECKELNKGYQFASLNSKENLQLTENTHTNSISKFTLDKIYTQSKVHSVTNKNRNSYMADKECQTEYPEYSEVIPYVKEFGESECQTVLSGKLRSYPSVDEKECQVKYSSFSEDTNTQTVCESECQTVLSGEIKLCAALTAKECQVKCPTFSQGTQTVNNSPESECQTELSGKIKSCPSVSQKECQVKWEMLPQGTQTLSSTNEEECQTEISGNIKFCPDSSSFGCQTVISGNVKKCANLDNKSCQASHISSLSSQTIPTSEIGSSSENECMSHVQGLDWASIDSSIVSAFCLPESKSSKLMCDTACQTISTGPVITKNVYFI